MHIHRFYIPQFNPRNPEHTGGIVLSAKEFKDLNHQILNVFRLKVGATIMIFNNVEGEWTAEIKGIDKKKGITIQLFQNTWTKETLAPEREITLYMSVIKNSNFDLVVQKAVELGVSHIVPVINERTVKTNLNFERLNKIVIEATEQCGRIDPFEISPIANFKDAIQDAQKSHDKVFFADISGMGQKHELAYKKIALFVGPEGGWSDEEVAYFHTHKIAPLCLGHYVLRAETAAIVGVAYLS